MAFGGGIGRRLIAGWAFGAVASLAGIAVSAALDLPTGATVVCAFGALLLVVWALAPRRAGGRA